MWTMGGRMKDVAFVARPSDYLLLQAHRQGETDLVCRDGKWFLIATIDYPTPAITTPETWLGVDLGIVQIATLSDGTNWDGGAVTTRRKKNIALRAKLQTKGTKSAKRLLKKRSRKESRFVRDVNHQISKRIVETAKRTEHGIALEDLTGIRERVRLRKPQRSTLHTWAFAQLGEFITYKAQQEGIEISVVDPAYTSQSCSTCGHTEKANRPKQDTFKCKSCGMSLHADHNAALNIAARGYHWAQSIVPSAAPHLTAS